MRAQAAQQKIYLFFEIMGHKKASAHHCTHIAKSRRLRTHSAPLQWYSRAFVIAVGRARFISVLLIFAHAHNWRNVFIRYIAACFGSSILRFEFMDFQNATNTKQTSEHKNPHFFFSRCAFPAVRFVFRLRFVEFSSCCVNDCRYYDLKKSSSLHSLNTIRKFKTIYIFRCNYFSGIFSVCSWIVIEFDEFQDN